ncbi:MAG TPA: ATP-binding protein, partial [Sporichthyaceae bacterium]|nr:ATP-binding protein [Sporichthyaceae bacterium]
MNRPTAGFDTARLRHTVLAAWAASPARFREDANAEEELVLGAYRDRLVVELAQNAADAATRAGRPGRLRLTLRQDDDAVVLSVANTGAPLNADGVSALCTLRASAKRDGPSVGRFGVGFAAVLAVSDAPAVHSRTGAVRWSALEAATAAAEIPALSTELAQRAGRAPVLRLPFDTGGAPPPGWDTEVVL